LSSSVFQGVRKDVAPAGAAKTRGPVAPPFGGKFDIALLIRADGEAAAIRAYHDWGTGVAQGKITYVRPAYRRQKLCDITWDLTVELLKQRGVTRLVYTVLASATAMKAACDKRGDRLVSHRYLREL
jgi:hypothetical protein